MPKSMMRSKLCRNNSGSTSHRCLLRNTTSMTSSSPCHKSISSLSSSPSPGAISHSLLSANTPRKVSFEDSPNGSECISSSEHAIVETKLQPSQQMMTRKRSLLARPKSTMSLVDLLQKASSEEERSRGCDASNTASAEVVMGEPRAKRICSPRGAPFDRSPRYSTVLLQEAPATVIDRTPAPSPWGQFVEMCVSEDDDDGHCIHLSSPCQSNNSSFCSGDCGCRSHRSTGSPYGVYHHGRGQHIHQRRVVTRGTPPPSLQLQESTFCLRNHLESTRNTNIPKFRLAPRKDKFIASDEQQQHQLLIGAFSDLNF